MIASHRPRLVGRASVGGALSATVALLFSLCTLHNIYAFEQRQEAP